MGQSVDRLVKEENEWKSVCERRKRSLDDVKDLLQDDLMNGSKNDEVINYYVKICLSLIY